MKNISIINVLSVLCAALTLTSLSSCQDEEFDWTAEEIATRTGFEKIFGKIDPNENYDYFVKYLESCGLATTRSTESTVTVSDLQTWAITEDLCTTAKSMFTENQQFNNTCLVAGDMISNDTELTFSTVWYGGDYEMGYAPSSNGGGTRRSFSFEFGIEVDGVRTAIFGESYTNNKTIDYFRNPKWTKTVTIPKNTAFKLYIKFKPTYDSSTDNICVQCNGTGYVSGGNTSCTLCGGDGKYCATCEGKGYTATHTERGMGYGSSSTPYYEICPDCGDPETNGKQPKDLVSNQGGMGGNNGGNTNWGSKSSNYWTSDTSKIGTGQGDATCTACDGTGYSTSCTWCGGDGQCDERIIYSNQNICILPAAGKYTSPTVKYYRIVAFEDAPYTTPQDFNDYLVCISADKDPVASANKKRFMCEDLSDVSRETSWDFNDIVCELQYNTSTSITINGNSKTLTTTKRLDAAVQAVGGTYPIYLYLTDGTNTVTVGGDELHKVMSNTIEQNSKKEFPPINVGASGGVTISSSNIYKHSYTSDDLDMTYFSTALDGTDNSYIYAKAYIGTGDYTTDTDESHWRTITYQSAGEPARMIAVTSSTKWMKEDKPIYNGYPGFTSANKWSPDWTDPKNDVYEEESTTTSN